MLPMSCRAFLIAIFFVGLPGSSTCWGQLIVAHRGASDDAPENTLAAFRLAWEQNADAIEGDFYLTKDHQIVAIHDKTTERTAGVNLDVRQETLARLQSLDAGSWKHGQFADERIPTLEQVCDTIPPTGRLVLEIKDSARIVPHLVQAIESTESLKALLPDRLLIISFDDKVVAAARKQLPQVKAMWLTNFEEDEATGRIQPSIQSILGTLSRIDATGLDCKAAAHIDENFARQLQNAGFEFHVWTVDNPRVARRFQKLGVDSITTNRPASIRQALGLVPAVTP